MKLGFGLPAAGAWATPENLARVARHAEALGYHSLWTFQTSSRVGPRSSRCSP